MIKFILIITFLTSFTPPKDSTVHVRRRGLNRVLFVKTPKHWDKSASRRNAVYVWKFKDIEVISLKKGKIKNK